MSAHPVTSFEATWPSTLAPVPSSSLQYSGFGNKAVPSSSYEQIQAATTEDRPNKLIQGSRHLAQAPSHLALGHEGLFSSSPDLYASRGARTNVHSPVRQRSATRILDIDTELGMPIGCSSASRVMSSGLPTEVDDQSDEDEELALTASDVEENVTEVGAMRTAMERPKEKRKLKRFRLTHNQTRFLTSEFTRQAHPDVAQRERLSREIPGLSPRQVQVWFQNRRAKLKRLTGDDQERVLKSRAPPEDFDTTQALRSAFGEHPRDADSHVSSPSYPPPFIGGGVIRHSLVDGNRRPEDSMMSPTSLNSTSIDFYTSSGSISASGNLSPISPISESSNFYGTSTSQTSSQRSSSLFARSSSFPAPFHAFPNIEELQIQEGMAKLRAESLTSPQGPRFPRTGSASARGEPQPSAMRSSFLSHPDQFGRTGSDASGFAADFGYRAMQNPVFPETYPDALADEQWQRFSLGGYGANGPDVATTSPALELGHQYASVDGLPDIRQAQMLQNSQSAPLAVQQRYQPPRVSESLPATAYDAPYPISFADGNTPYPSQLPLSHDGLQEENTISTFTPDVAFGIPPQQVAAPGFANVETGNVTLRPRANFGRRRSFTHPMDYNSFR